METNYGLQYVLIFLINLYELNSYEILFLHVLIHNFEKDVSQRYYHSVG